MEVSSDPYLPYDGGGDGIPLRELHKRGIAYSCCDSVSCMSLYVADCFQICRGVLSCFLNGVLVSQCIIWKKTRLYCFSGRFFF